MTIVIISWNWQIFWRPILLTPKSKQFWVAGHFATSINYWLCFDFFFSKFCWNYTHFEQHSLKTHKLARKIMGLVWKIMGILARLWWKCGRNFWKSGLQLLSLRILGAPGALEGAESISTIKKRFKHSSILIFFKNRILARKLPSELICGVGRQCLLQLLIFDNSESNGL